MTFPHIMKIKNHLEIMTKWNNYHTDIRKAKELLDRQSFLLISFSIFLAFVAAPPS